MWNPFASKGVLSQLASYYRIKSLPDILQNNQKHLDDIDPMSKIQHEYGSFSKYLWQWTDERIIHEKGKTSSELSDSISKDLKKRGMKFVGTTVIYAYLQAVGIIWSHEDECFCSRETLRLK